MNSRDPASPNTPTQINEASAAAGEHLTPPVPQWWDGLRASALARNQARVAELTQWCQKWTAQAQIEPAELDQAKRVVHELVGSAGTFGHNAVSQLARELQSHLNALTATSDAAAAAAWLAQLREIDAQLGEPAEAIEVS